jgi:malate dehydrogenase (oxaloacetate-decarboxylating)(NADP+)
MDAYRQDLSRFVYATGMLMSPVFAAARAAPAATKRVAYAEGEDERVLRAVQMVIEDGLARPILIGRPAVIQARIAKAGLRLQLGKDFECVNPEDDPRFRLYWETYHRLMGRHGVTPDAAKAAVRRSTTTIASLMVKLGDADALLCGLVGRFDVHLDHIRDIIGPKLGGSGFATLNALMLEKAHAVHCRHLRQRGPQRRAAGQHRPDGRR